MTDPQIQKDERRSCAVCSGTGLEDTSGFGDFACCENCGGTGWLDGDTEASRIAQDLAESEAAAIVEAYNAMTAADKAREFHRRNDAAAMALQLQGPTP